jgi:60 kDa SS-A/Ro ribonucleoprotein
LPVEVQSLNAYRDSESEEAQALITGGLDNVRWDLLSDAAKRPTVWAALARKMGPQALLMNLNALLRHGVFDQPAGASLRLTMDDAAEPDDNAFPLMDSHNVCNMVDYVADRIADVSDIRRSYRSCRDLGSLRFQPATTESAAEP